MSQFTFSGNAFIFLFFLGKFSQPVYLAIKYHRLRDFFLQKLSFLRLGIFVLVNFIFFLGYSVYVQSPELQRAIQGLFLNAQKF